MIFIRPGQTTFRNASVARHIAALALYLYFAYTAFVKIDLVQNVLRVHQTYLPAVTCFAIQICDAVTEPLVLMAVPCLYALTSMNIVKNSNLKFTRLTVRENKIPAISTIALIGAALLFVDAAFLAAP